MKQYLKMIPIKTCDEKNHIICEQKVWKMIMMILMMMNIILMMKYREYQLIKYPFTDTSNKLKKKVFLIFLHINFVYNINIQDVILQIDGIEIGDDGAIKFGKNSCIDLNYAITNKFDGDTVSLKILRNGIILDIIIKIQKHNPLCPVHLFNAQPDYFIFGGLVFLSLSRPFLQHKFGHDSWRKKTPSTLKCIYFNRLKEFKHQQCIVLSQVLASDITVGYHNYKHYILETINDNKKNKIRN